jgi:glycosyltransferase involved in cell wall biosynthesis
MVTTVTTTLRAFLLPFARHYRAMGWQVDAAARDIADAPDMQREFDACHALPLSRSLSDVQVLLDAPRAIRQLVADGGYDIVHVHTPVAAFMVRFALRGLPGRPRVVYTAHGFHFHRYGNPLSNMVFRFAERIAAPWCDALVTINREDFEAARAGRFATRVEYMPGIGVDTTLWNPARATDEEVQAVRRELGLAADAVLFLMVAEFNPGKRHRDVLAALQQVDDKNVHIAFAGDGALRAQMQERAKELGLGERTHFLGFRRDIPALMRAARAVLLPSEREGLPRCLLEALSMGVPIIGSDIRGISELAGECGLLHAVGDSAGLAAALQQLARHPEDALQMGRQGRARMVADYDEKGIIGLHDRLYADLLGIPHAQTTA